MGDVLIVGVHSDEDILKHKGPTVMKEHDRSPPLSTLFLLFASFNSKKKKTIEGAVGKVGVEGKKKQEVQKGTHPCVRYAAVRACKWADEVPFPSPSLFAIY